jgi:hypothetical protein
LGISLCSIPKRQAGENCMFNEKAQATLVDIMFGVFIFSVILAMMISFYGTNLENTQKQQLQTDLETKAFQTIDQLIRFKGKPNNWNELTINEVNLFGIAKRDRIIDENKLSKLSSLAITDYNTVKQKLNIGQYDFLLELQGIDNVSIGITPISEATIVVVRRIANYRGQEANVQLSLYKLR